MAYKNFNFQYKPIYLQRHPFAVVGSQLAHGACDYPFTGFLIPDCPYKNFYDVHSDFLLSLKTKEEALVAIWCLANMVPLSNPRNNIDWITVYYEHLIKHPYIEFSRIFKIWELPIPVSLFNQISVPSSTTKEPTFQKSVENQLSKWKHSFSEIQIKKMDAVLQYFNVKIYNNDILPLV